MGLRVAELFAGVGGFRLGLEAAGHEVVWSNQWEPGTKAQHASECYTRQFGPVGHSNEDIHNVAAADIPDHDLLVGGFPCQDYSVAATLDKSGGIEGKKGVLWWQIDRILRKKRPAFVLLENVDRILRSPVHQRGRDFGMVLRCLGALGYRVEWRVINAADYGFPQKRRRTFIFAARKDTPWGQVMTKSGMASDFLESRGFFAGSFPVVKQQALLLEELEPSATLPNAKQDVSNLFDTHFRKAGVMVGRKIWTRDVRARTEPIRPLKTVLEPKVSDDYYVAEDQIARWEYFKLSKSETRVAENGHEYKYAEGRMQFPDPINQPARTILTGEGGSASRSNHIIRDPKTGRLRKLTPLECERLNGFPDNWTEGMPERRRYFVMGNALVVGVVERMAHKIALKRVARRLVAAK